jgi:hypothetical protein
MPTIPGNPRTQESDGAICVQSHKGRTWFPILLGVLCGMIALCPLAGHEPAAFYRLTARMFNETPPKKMIEPRSVHFMLFMLTLTAVGGSIGVLFSRWRKRTSLLFLLAVLLVIAAFCALGSALDAPGSVWDRLRFH